MSPPQWIAARLHLGTWKSASLGLPALRKINDKGLMQPTYANAIV